MKVRNTRTHELFIRALESHGASYEEADRLFFAIRRLGLRNERQCMIDNDGRFYNQAQSDHENELIWRRMQQLAAECARYGARLSFPGIFPYVEVEGFGHVNVYLDGE